MLGGGCGGVGGQRGEKQLQSPHTGQKQTKQGWFALKTLAAAGPQHPGSSAGVMKSILVTW